MHAASLEEPYKFTPPSQTTNAPADSLERQTRHEISQLIAELSELCRSNLPESRFWPDFSTKLMRALAADGAVIWKSEPDQTHQAILRVGTIHDLTIPEERRSAHHSLLNEVASHGRPVLVPPTADLGEGPANPSGAWIAVVPVESGAEGGVLLEAFLGEVGGPSAQRGYLKFIAQMADLAGEYLRTATLNSYRQQRQQREIWGHWHAQLNQAHSLAEVRRRVVDGAAECLNVARASWLESTPWGWQLKASTGIDSPDPRGPAGRWLSERVAQSLQQNPHIHIDASNSDADNPTNLCVVATVPIYWPMDSAPELERIDLATELQDGRRCLPGHAKRTAQTEAPMAILVMQDANGKTWTNAQTHMSQEISRSVAGALRATVVAGALPWLGPWLLRRQHQSSWIRPIAIATLCFCAMAGILLLPVPLRVVAPATLEPVAISVVQAPRDATVQSLLVEHAQPVQNHAPLVELFDPELDRQEEQLLGQQAVLSKRGLELQRLIVRGSEPNRRTEWEAEQGEVTAELAALKRQLQWVAKQRESLVVLSPREGKIDGWEAKQKFVGRQVRRGEPLLRVFDPNGPWRVRTEIPQNRLNHVIQALARNPPLSVTVVLRSFPDQPTIGTMMSLGPTTSTNHEGMPVGWSDVTINAATLPLKQQGAAASVAIDCGHRALGYVLFQDLIRAFTGWWKLWVA
jgi:hypothetical protein